MLPAENSAIDGSISRIAAPMDGTTDSGGFTRVRATKETFGLYSISSGVQKARDDPSVRLKYFPFSTTPTISNGFAVGPVEKRRPRGFAPSSNSDANARFTIATRSV